MRMLAKLGMATLFACGLVATTISTTGAQAPPAVTKKSKVKVLLPQDDAELKIEDKATKATGKERTFDTPALDVAKTYEYKLTAEWKPNNYTIMTRNKSASVSPAESAANARRGSALNTKIPQQPSVSFASLPSL